MKMSLTGLLKNSETEKNLGILNSLISQFKPKDDGKYKDSGIVHTLFMLKLATQNGVLKEKCYKALFNGERPFYSESFNF